MTHSLQFLTFSHFVEEVLQTFHDYSKNHKMQIQLQ